MRTNIDWRELCSRCGVHQAGCKKADCPWKIADEKAIVVRRIIDGLWREELQRREVIAENFLTSGAFPRDLGAVEVAGVAWQLNSWRIA